MGHGRSLIENRVDDQLNKCRMMEEFVDQSSSDEPTEIGSENLER